jgi:hypothetical protein
MRGMTYPVLDGGCAVGLAVAELREVLDAVAAKSMGITARQLCQTFGPAGLWQRNSTQLV